MKRYLLLGLLVASFFLRAPVVSAQQLSEQSLEEQITILLQLIEDLEAELAVLQAESAPVSDPESSGVSTEVIPVGLLTPASGGTFRVGDPIMVSWEGGGEKVQVGVIDSSYETNGSVLGWITLNGKADDSYVWDGADVVDITGTVNWPIGSLSPGPFKIIVVSAGATGSYCVDKVGDCNYSQSDAYFTILFPPSSGIQVSCAPTVSPIRAGDMVTWVGFASHGRAPYTYTWHGMDGISAIPPRFLSDGKYVDLFYRSSGIKTAGVTVRDSKGEETYASCKASLTVTPALNTLTLLSPNGGETLTLTKTWDKSQFVKVAWQEHGLDEFGGETMSIVLEDSFGRECKLGSTSPLHGVEHVGLVSGYVCPGSNAVLVPGTYKMKIYIDGQKATTADTSDTPITLVAPKQDVQSIVSMVPSIKSGEKGKFRFVFPADTVRASLYVYCPAGISALEANVCNKYTDVTSYMATSTEFAVTLYNTSLLSENVSANFYVYLPNNLNYSRGVSARVTVNPVIATSTVSVTVLSPNGGEKLYYGESSSFTFKASMWGDVDLTLVPYPTIDARLVCKIATNVSTVTGSITVAIPSKGECVNGPAETIDGTYKLFAAFKSGGATLATDLSDASFTIMATSTATSTPAE